VTAVAIVDVAPMDPGARLWPMSGQVFEMSGTRLALEPADLPGGDGRTVDVRRSGVGWFPPGAPFGHWGAKVLTPAMARLQELRTVMAQRSMRREDLDGASRAALERAERLNVAYAQRPGEPIPVEEQTAVIVGAAWGHADGVPLARMWMWEEALRGYMRRRHGTAGGLTRRGGSARVPRPFSRSAWNARSR
jgi:hypothetical protein